MTSSKSYELTLLQDENQTVLKFDVRDPVQTTTSEEAFRTDRPVFLRISGPEDDTEVRVRVSTDVVGYLSAQLTFSERNIQPSINDLYGDAELIVETRNAYDFEAQWRVLFAYMVPLTSPRETAQLYETLIRELESAHLSLARDFMGGSVLRVENHARSPFVPRVLQKLNSLLPTRPPRLPSIFALFYKNLVTHKLILPLFTRIMTRRSRLLITIVQRIALVILKSDFLHFNIGVSCGTLS